MTKNKNNTDKRRFQRVYFEVNENEDQSINGLEAVWLSGSRVSVFDISYTGAAVVRPKDVDLKVCHSYDLKFEFQGKHVCEMEAEIMWFNDHIVGLAFSELSGEDRVRFSEFLDDKLIGANLRRVKEEFIGPNSDFDLWFQGPKEVSVYVWLDENRSPAKLQVELEEQVFEWEKRGGVTLGHSIQERVLDLLGQIEDEKEVFGQLVQAVNAHNK